MTEAHIANLKTVARMTLSFKTDEQIKKLERAYEAGYDDGQIMLARNILNWLGINYEN